MDPVKGTTNGYPEGQCTRWADDQYHAATGYYIPWSGNAGDWSALARGYGWTVSSTPIVPSIMCLAPGVQGASSQFGHVGEVISVGKDTFVASNLNWGNTPHVPIDVTFRPGPGVSFIYATDNNGRPIGNTTPTIGQTLSSFMSGGGSGPVSLAPNADVTALLAAFDNVLALVNPFSVPEAQTDTFDAAGVSFSFTDPISYIEGFGMNLIEDLNALVIRTIFLIVGVFVLFKVLSNFIDFGAAFDVVKGAAMVAAL